MFYITQYHSPLGLITLASTKDSLVGLWIKGQKYELLTATKDIIQRDDLPILCTAKKWLDEYFADKNPAISDLSLAPIGNPFRQEVWQILTHIPYGQTVTYGQVAKEVAERMGKPRMSAQAVGGAVGHNHISLIIPCHRVIGAGGNLTGYAGGIDIKIKLLQHEGVDTSKMFLPRRA